jgi:hypothetical protein
MTQEQIAEKRRAAASLQAGVIEGDKHAAATLVKLMNEVLDDAWENTEKPYSSTIRQLDGRIVTVYGWRSKDNGGIPPEHIEALQETAMEQIAAGHKIGFMGGKLKDNIHMTDADPEDGIAYFGYWNSTFEELRSSK